MSLIDDAFKRATSEVKQEPVIQIPAEPRRNRVAQSVMLISFLTLALALVLQVRSETRTRAAETGALGQQLISLENKYNDLMRVIEKNDQYLDTRVQLDILELKSDTKALQSKLGALGVQDMSDFRAESATLRDYLKTEIYFVNKRLHENDREHYLLSQRIDALKDQPSPDTSGDSPAA